MKNISEFLIVSIKTIEIVENLKDKTDAFSSRGTPTPTTKNMQHDADDLKRCNSYIWILVYIPEEKFIPQKNPVSYILLPASR